MVLHRSPDGRSYGYYQRDRNGSLGFLPVIAAGIQALPAIMSLFNPAGPPPPPPPPDNTPLLIGAGLAGLMVVGGIAYVLFKR